MKFMKILEIHVRITKVMKIIEIHWRMTTNIICVKKNQCENYENLEKLYKPIKEYCKSKKC